MEKVLFKKVVIVGLGLMGGSLGLAIKKNKIAEQTVGLVRRSETVKEALKIKAVDYATKDMKTAVADADLIVLAVPVLTAPLLFQLLLPMIPEKCLITDVGSTKAVLVKTMNRIVAKANKTGKQLIYIGSHPMTGSEKTGVLASKDNLYEQSVCLLTSQDQNKNAQTKLKRFWKAVGCKTVLEVVGRQHDQMVAMASHLPHVLAVLLTSLLEQQAKRKQALLQVIGSGFRDTTRIAAGSPEMWADIFISNAKEITKAIEMAEKELVKLKKLINQKNYQPLYQMLKRVQEFRQKVDRT